MEAQCPVHLQTVHSSLQASMLVTVQQKQWPKETPVAKSEEPALHQEGVTLLQLGQFHSVLSRHRFYLENV